LLRVAITVAITIAVAGVIFVGGIIVLGGASAALRRWFGAAIVFIFALLATVSAW